MDKEAWDPDLKMDGSNETTSWQLLVNPSDILRTRVVDQNGVVTYPILPNSSVSEKFFHLSPDVVWIITPTDANGVFTGSYRSKDETGSIGAPGIFNINVLPVNDPPEIRVTVPYTVTMGSWNPISLKAYDKDSKEWYIQVDIEDSMKGSLKESRKIDSNGKATGSPVPKGDTSYFSSKTYGQPGLKEFTLPLMFKADGVEYSCDLLNGKTACDPVNDIYSWFIARAVDKEGLKTAFVNITIIVLRADVPPQPPLEDLWCTLRQGGSAICTFTGVDVNTVKQPFSSYLTSFPQGLTFFQVTDNGKGVAIDVVGPNKGLISDPQGRVFVVGDPDFKGDDKTNPLFLATFGTYALQNTLGRSDNKDIGFIVLPVNQPPVPITDKIIAKEETPVFVNILATDPDNTIDELTFVLTRIPDINAAAFYRFDPTKASTIGARVEPSDLPFTVEVQSCEAFDKEVTLGACIWFLGAENVYTTLTSARKRGLVTPINLAYSVSDTPRYAGLLPFTPVARSVQKKLMSLLLVLMMLLKHNLLLQLNKILFQLLF